MDSIEERVRAVLQRVLKVDPNTLKDDDRFVEDLGAESIQSIELVAEFESEFDVEMEEDDALTVKTVGGAVAFMRRLVE